jgi:hypothetical protein
LHSYLEFAPYTWQGDYIEGIQWARTNPEQVLDMITQGQKYVEENYSARVLSKRFIDEIIKQLRK